MLLDAPRTPLRAVDLPVPTPGPEQVLVRVRACGMCRTDLHVMDGELAEPKLPLVLGHEIVGTVAGKGERVERFALGDRVRVPWLGWTCGRLPLLPFGPGEPLRPAPASPATRSTAATPSTPSPTSVLFLLAARTYSDRGGRAADLRRPDRLPRPCVMAGAARRLGLYGFGAAAHMLPRSRARRAQIFAFTRAGDSAAQMFARDAGCVWAGGFRREAAGRTGRGDHLRPGRGAGAGRAAGGAQGRHGRLRRHPHERHPRVPYVSCGGSGRASVANLTRRDGEEFLALAPRCRSGRRCSLSRLRRPTRR